MLMTREANCFSNLTSVPRKRDAHCEGCHAPEPLDDHHDCADSWDGTPIFRRHGCGSIAEDNKEGADDDEYELEGGWEDEQCLKDFFR